MKGKILDFFPFTTPEGKHKTRLTLELDDWNCSAFLEGLKDKVLDISLKVFREKRSIDQNKYAWELIGKIADKLRAAKDEIYLLMLKRYGQGGLIKIRPSDEKNVLRALKYYERHEELYNDGEKYYKVWAGSSGYNTEEMTVFIDGVISEAQNLGIETMTPDQLAEMRSLEESRR